MNEFSESTLYQHMKYQRKVLSCLCVTFLFAFVSMTAISWELSQQRNALLMKYESKAIKLDRDRVEFAHWELRNIRGLWKHGDSTIESIQKIEAKYLKDYTEAEREEARRLAR